MKVLEKQFTFKGLPCLVIFDSEGYRSGYVGVPRGHVLFGATNSRINRHVSMDDPVQYAGVYTSSDDTCWWFGFDCKKYGIDEQAMEVYFPDKKLLQIPIPYTDLTAPKTLDYVMHECKKLAMQIN